MINIICNGLKRLLCGTTNVFAVRSGSCALRGNSFVSIYKERTKIPVRLTGIKFVTQPDALGEWRICVAGIGKVFPYDVNPIDSEFHNLTPVEIAAGELFCIEVKSRNAEYKGVIILEELDIIEIR